jgi:hypothetical protein
MRALDEMAVAAVETARRVEVAGHVALRDAAATKTSESAIDMTTVTVAIAVIAATVIGLAALTTVSAIRRNVSEKMSAHAVMLLLVMLTVNASLRMMLRVNARTARATKVCSRYPLPFCDHIADHDYIDHEEAAPAHDDLDTAE